MRIARLCVLAIVFSLQNSGIRVMLVEKVVIKQLMTFVKHLYYNWPVDNNLIDS